MFSGRGKKKIDDETPHFLSSWTTTTCGNTTSTPRAPLSTSPSEPANSHNESNKDSELQNWNTSDLILCFVIINIYLLSWIVTSVADSHRASNNLIRRTKNQKSKSESKRNRIRRPVAPHIDSGAASNCSHLHHDRWQSLPRGHDHNNINIISQHKQKCIVSQQQHNTGPTPIQRATTRTSHCHVHRQERIHHCSITGVSTR